MIVVDTSVWIAWIRDYDNHSTRNLNELMTTRRVILGDLVLMEVLQGARDQGHANALSRRFNRLLRVTMCSPRLAVIAAANYRRLRSLGITVRSSIDMIVGTYCIEHGHALLQDDRDFSPMAEHLGLKLI